MISLHIRIADAPPSGCAIEMIPQFDHPSEMETLHFYVLDRALNTACQMILECATSGTMLEEDDLSSRVRAAFQRMTQKSPGS